MSEEPVSSVRLPGGFRKLTGDSTIDQFELWEIRFVAFIIQTKPDLHSFLEVEFDSDEAVAAFIKSKASLARFFSALLISALSDDLIVRFKRQMDLKIEGLKFYRHLRSLWVKKMDLVSLEERLLLFLKKSVPLSDVDSVDAFMRESQDILHVMQQSQSKLVPFVERLVLHNILQRIPISTFPWASTMAAEWNAYLRSPEVRSNQETQVPEQFSIASLFEKVRFYTSPSYSQAKSTVVCSFCHRSGHKADRCYDAHPELKKPGKTQKAKVSALAAEEDELTDVDDWLMDKPRAPRY